MTQTASYAGFFSAQKVTKDSVNQTIWINFSRVSYFYQTPNKDTVTLLFDGNFSVEITNSFATFTNYLYGLGLWVNE